MKSLLISSTYFPPQIGGISSYMASVVRCLPPGEISCLTGVQAEHDFRPEGVQAHIYRRPGVFAKSGYLQGPAVALTAAEIMLRERPDVVQVATAYDGYLALLLNQWLKLPFVIYAHGNEILDAARASYPKPRLSLQRAARVLANSHFTAGLVCNLGVDPNKIVVLHPGCHVELFRPQAASIAVRQKMLGEHHDQAVILTVGNLVRRKGHDMVIKALPRVLRDVPNAVYMVVGEGPYRPELELLAVETGVRNRVIFAGRIGRDQLPQLYALADVFIMPSRMHPESCDVEGFGMVFLEACACGKPVVGGRCGGIPDAIVDGVTGFLVDPNSPSEIANRLVMILQNADLARQFGDEGRNRVLREFTWKHFATKLREILGSVLEDSRFSSLRL